MRCSNCGVFMTELRRAKEYPPDQPSLKEAQVAAMIIQGATNAEIAAHFNVTVGTIKFHVTRMYKKLQITKRRPELIYAWHAGQFTKEVQAAIQQFMPDKSGVQIPKKEGCGEQTR